MNQAPFAVPAQGQINLLINPAAHQGQQQAQNAPLNTPPLPPSNPAGHHLPFGPAPNQTANFDMMGPMTVQGFIFNHQWGPLPAQVVHLPSSSFYSPPTAASLPTGTSSVILRPRSDANRIMRIFPQRRRGRIVVLSSRKQWDSGQEGGNPGPGDYRC